MDDVFQVIGHAGFTYVSWLMSHVTEIGAGILMLLQGILLVSKLYDRFKKK